MTARSVANAHRSQRDFKRQTVLTYVKALDGGSSVLVSRKLNKSHHASIAQGAELRGRERIHNAGFRDSDWGRNC